MRRTIPIVLVVLLAGCLGGGVGSSDTVDGPPDAEWTDGQGIDETALADRHFEALRSAGSFTLDRNSTVAVDGEIHPRGDRPDWHHPPSSTHTAVDLDDGRLLRRSATAGHSQATRFVSADEDATRRRDCTSDDCDWEYRYLERSDHDTTVGQIDRYRRQRAVETMVEVLDDWAYTYDGTTERDGRTVYRYTAEWTFDKPVHPFVERPTGTGTLLVSEAGVVVKWEYRYAGPAEVAVDGERRTVNVTQRQVQSYTAVGETTVERPAWVDRARSNDPPLTTVTAEASD